jgi:hypothetical protein
MIKKILKYTLIFLFLISVMIIFYLTQMFGKKLNKKEVASYLYKNTDTSFKIRYFGTMCFYMEYKGHAILTDPFFSNPNPVRLFYYPKVNEKYLKLFSKDELSRIKTILIGHAHYDHCLELPLFINHSEPVNILANQSVINLFQTQYPHNHYIKGEDFVKSQQWFYNQDSTIRIYFIDTEHGPHFGNTVLMNGENLPQKSPPSNLAKWQCGKSMSYIIDFIQNDIIEKRIVFNGGKMNFPVSSKDTAVALEHKADMIILLGWNKNELASKFKAVQLFKPDNIILGHWNNFFNTGNGSHQYIRKSDLPETLKSVNLMNPDFKTTIMIPETLEQ